MNEEDIRNEISYKLRNSQLSSNVLFAIVYKKELALYYQSTDSYEQFYRYSDNLKNTYVLNKSIIYYKKPLEINIISENKKLTLLFKSSNNKLMSHDTVSVACDDELNIFYLSDDEYKIDYTDNNFDLIDKL